MKEKGKEAYTAGIERIFDLMTNPDMSRKRFCEKWEVSRKTFFRYKAYIKDRLFMYEIRRKDNEM